MQNRKPTNPTNIKGKLAGTTVTIPSGHEAADASNKIAGPDAKSYLAEIKSTVGDKVAQVLEGVNAVKKRNIEAQQGKTKEMTSDVQEPAKKPGLR